MPARLIRQHDLPDPHSARPNSHAAQHGHPAVPHQEGKALAVLAAGLARQPDLSYAAHRLKQGGQIALLGILGQALWCVQRRSKCQSATVSEACWRSQCAFLTTSFAS